MIIELATGAGEDELNAPWPGHLFRLGNMFLVALLETPRGREVVYLLAQLASGLPGKDIESVAIFTTESTGSTEVEAYHLLFTLTGRSRHAFSGLTRCRVRFWKVYYQWIYST